MKNGDFGLRFAAVVLVLVLAPAAAMAYIDPGNGAYMVQALFTLVGAALFYLRHPFRSIRLVWRRFFGGGEADSAEFDAEDAALGGPQKITAPEGSPAGSETLSDGR